MTDRNRTLWAAGRGARAGASEPAGRTSAPPGRTLTSEAPSVLCGPSNPTRSPAPMGCLDRLEVSRKWGQKPLRHSDFLAGAP